MARGPHPKEGHEARAMWENIASEFGSYSLGGVSKLGTAGPVSTTLEDSN